jgi:hypothetical protein
MFCTEQGSHPFLNQCQGIATTAGGAPGPAEAVNAQSMIVVMTIIAVRAFIALSSRIHPEFKFGALI